MSDFDVVYLQERLRQSLVAMNEAINENERYFFKGKSEGLAQVIEHHFGSVFVKEVRESLNL
ncbi:hypothetical protein FE783_36890 [Paenibacillus mesophilus]|uniref:hypothetical protein n=1 Tax=Paenibacillus mesophilus TaxID=2582849 RepID=UPI00110E104E|nr:hypothetical protein [Paenibacillus mesophilus]TMV42792.1 hypothetical protein FE783_36890 [Paenibacillus mesophilus]